MKKPFQNGLWVLAGMLMLAAGSASANQQCEKGCREDVRECENICKKHAGAGTNKCVQACKDEHKECSKECKSHGRNDR